MKLRGLPIFWQTLLLLFASLVASQAVSIAMLLALPAPRPDFNRLSDIGDTLAGQTPDSRHDSRERALIVRTSATPPVAGERMTSDPRFSARLAARIGVDPSRVLLFYEPDQRASFPFRDSRRPGRMVPMRRGEPLFFNTVVAAVKMDDGWRVVQTPPRPIVSAWQERLILWFGVSALVLLPFAWIFARALTRPIRSFAEAADRMGGDPLAPRVPEQGPAELRTAAHALNRMQQRLADYVAERTAMIGAIAHDLRTPLTRIAFRIEAAPDTVRDRVHGDIEQMRAMIAATIGFVRGATHAGEVSDVHLDQLLGRLVEEDRDIGRPVTAGPMAPVTMRGDPVALARLFQNLIDNGVIYGGDVLVTLAREGTEAVVRVADRGPGVPEERVEKLFQPFERGDPSRSRATGGIGLGLTIARGIASEHGGTLTLRNRASGGVEAVCRFPLR
ncbi:MAG TPA: ATP-binding protein [Sphingomonadaceae bacterium]|nr:ATP-binding protein [Sphingomonadaceae bacterium]